MSITPRILASLDLDGGSAVSSRDKPRRRNQTKLLDILFYSHFFFFFCWFALVERIIWANKLRFEIFTQHSRWFFDNHLLFYRIIIEYGGGTREQYRAKGAAAERGSNSENWKIKNKFHNCLGPGVPGRENASTTTSACGWIQSERKQTGNKSSLAEFRRSGLVSYTW